MTCIIVKMIEPRRMTWARCVAYEVDEK